LRESPFTQPRAATSRATPEKPVGNASRSAPSAIWARCRARPRAT